MSGVGLSVIHWLPLGLPFCSHCLGMGAGQWNGESLAYRVLAAMLRKD